MTFRIGCVALLPHVCFVALGVEPPVPSEAVNNVLPGWVKFKAEYRARWEGISGIQYVAGADDHYLLSRWRFDVAVQPTKWLSLGAETQDSRIYWNSIYPSGPPYQDEWDLRLAWVDLKPLPGLTIKTGRQELSIGDQRLVGPANWGNLARVFDAVRADWVRGPLSIQAFAASVVANRSGQFNRHVDGDDIHGVVGILGGLPGNTRLEGQGLWRLAPHVTSELGAAGKLDIKTYVFRGTGDITQGTRYITEMAAQHGNRAGDSQRAWAGHWRVMRDIPASDWKPVAVGVYDYATGDKDPRDGRVETFDVLYPTPHDKYGLADQVGWKNIHHLEGRLEVNPRKNLKLEAKQHWWWLASPTDGVYTAGGAPVVRDPLGRSGRYVGREFDLQAIWAASKQISLGMGVGRIWPGTFLRNTTPGADLTFSYVMFTYGL